MSDDRRILPMPVPTKKRLPAGKEAPDRRVVRVSDKNWRLLGAVSSLEDRDVTVILDELIEKSDLRDRLKKATHG